MQIAQKLTLPLALSVFAVLGVATLFAARADLQLQEDDIRRDQFIASQLLASAISPGGWSTSRSAQAIALVDDANKNQNRVLFLFLFSNELATKGSLNARSIEPLKRGRDDLQGRSGAVGHGVDLAADEPARRAAGARSGCRSPWRCSASPSSASSRTQAGTAIALGVLWAIVAIGLGAIIVGQPMRKLTEQAKRIGAGDLTHPLHIEQRDEIGSPGAADEPHVRGAARVAQEPGAGDRRPRAHRGAAAPRRPAQHRGQARLGPRARAGHAAQRHLRPGADDRAGRGDGRAGEGQRAASSRSRPRP